MRKAPGTTPRRYSWNYARRDLMAGLTVAAIAVPQAMAYALIAGIDPRLRALFGHRGHGRGLDLRLVVAPDQRSDQRHFAGVVQRPGLRGRQPARMPFEATFLLAVMAGVIQILVAVFRLGDLTRYISESVVIGFMAGAGLLIALTQVGNLFGLTDRGTGHQHILVRLWLTLTQGGAVNLRALAIGLGTAVLVVLLRKVTRRYRLPRLDMLLALAIAATAAAVLGWSQPAERGRTGGRRGRSKSGRGFRSLHVPALPARLDAADVRQRLAVAFLGLLEALAIAKSISLQTRQPLDYNRQCLAEGLANLCGGFFQCLPGSGSLTRSAINFQAGAVTRWSGVFAAAAVALVVCAFRPAGRVHSQGGPGGHPAGDRRRADRSAAAPPRRAGEPLRRLAGAGHGLVRRVHRRRVFDPHRRRPVDPDVRAPRRPAEGHRAGRRRGPRRSATASPTILAARGWCSWTWRASSSSGPRRSWTATSTRCASVPACGSSCCGSSGRGIRTSSAWSGCSTSWWRCRAKGVTVLLCGVRPDFAQAMQNLRFQDFLPADRVFPEDAAHVGSATLAAVRHAYELLGDDICEHCPRRTPPEPAKGAFYYQI